VLGPTFFEYILEIAEDSITLQPNRRTQTGQGLESLETVKNPPNIPHSNQSDDSSAGNCNSITLPHKSDISLSPEQNSVLNRVREGRSVFFTGSAGTGKSVLLREIVRMCGGCASHTLGITASTGIASVNIGGTTLHSWAGIGLGQESEKNLVGKFFGQKKFRNVLERWLQVKTLIIDEVSMIDGDLFDKLEYMARKLRHDEKPFGGIQVHRNFNTFDIKLTAFGSIPSSSCFRATSVSSPQFLRAIRREYKVRLNLHSMLSPGMLV